MKLIPLLLIITLASCHTVRQTTSSSINVDSLATHIRDSTRQVISYMQYEHEQQIKQITSSGVTFQPVQCPDLSTVRASLDSIGKINFDLAITKDSIIRALQNKVSIARDGTIKAEGYITSVYTTNSVISRENSRLSTINDSLWAVHDSDVNRLSRVQSASVTVVKKTFIPWWMYVIAALGFVLWFYKLIPKRPI